MREWETSARVVGLSVGDFDDAVLVILPTETEALVRPDSTVEQQRGGWPNLIVRYKISVRSLGFSKILNFQRYRR